ncbi:uncharacterized protein LOC119676426 [Teleopsis dalmanni]|uniref:uncharacterized protein LOC119676426 n=1 Tax=Teleopsis dalmanni TaxID=139649 RepID=UPI0018CD3B3D|nr:uncharacterized protein LOC119676426 [Teleopsis dalmanni]
MSYSWCLIAVQSRQRREFLRKWKKKYVSELSTVRDCATECVEKEVWETQTFCCDQDGCNGANELQISKFILLLCLPIIYMVYSSIGSVFKARR